jgi:hypothetical protein
MTALLISAALLAPCHSQRPHGCEIRHAASSASMASCARV